MPECLKLNELDTGYIDAYGNPIYSGDRLNYCYAVRRNVQLTVCSYDNKWMVKDDYGKMLELQGIEPDDITINNRHE